MGRQPRLDANKGAYIVPLGTSSAIPTLQRGLAATLLVRRDGRILLFDGGEGTQLQFLRSGLSYGKLRRIFVTHLHLDHYGGLFGLISRMCLGNSDQELHVYGPRGIARLLQLHLRHTLRHAPLRFELIELEHDHRGPVCRGPDYTISAAPLDHVIPTLGYRYEEDPRPGAFDGARAEAEGLPHGPERALLQRGESITLPDGRTFHPDDFVAPPRPGPIFAYVTDTRPCPGGLELARDAHILQHESTFDNSIPDIANQRGHSTIGQAHEIARRAGARLLLASHFSTRYDEGQIRALLAPHRNSAPPIRIARDLEPLALQPR